MTPMWVWESNPGHIGGRQLLSPLRHPFSPKFRWTSIKCFHDHSPVLLAAVEFVMETFDWNVHLDLTSEIWKNVVEGRVWLINHCKRCIFHSKFSHHHYNIRRHHWAKSSKSRATSQSEVSEKKPLKLVCCISYNSEVPCLLAKRKKQSCGRFCGKS